MRTDQPSQIQIILSMSSASCAKVPAISCCPLIASPSIADEQDFMLHIVVVLSLLCLIRALFVRMDQASLTQIQLSIYIYGDGREVYTRQDCSDRMEGVPDDSTTCHGLSLAFGVPCGCPTVGNPCTMCKDGDKMSKRDKEFVFTVGVEVIQYFLNLDGPMNSFFNLDETVDSVSDSVSTTCSSAGYSFSALLQQDNMTVIGISCYMDRPVGVLILSNRPVYLLPRLVELYCLHHWYCVHSGEV